MIKVEISSDAFDDLNQGTYIWIQSTTDEQDTRR